MTLTIGSVCTGSGALDQAVVEVLGDAAVVWTADPDPAVSTLLEHRYPDVPNLGDVTATDWAVVEPVDVFTAGFPCQDVSPAGRRAGLVAGTRSGLWHHLATAIEVLRPRLVVLENVRGLLTARGAPATPELLAAEAEAARYGRVLDLIGWKLDRARKGRDRDRIQRLTRDRYRIVGRRRAAVDAARRADALIVRAIGTVLGDLADRGFDAVWCVLPASTVDAPHKRERVFIVAADTGRVGVQRRPDDRGVPRPEGPGDRQGLQRERRRDPVGDGGAVAADAERGGREAGSGPAGAEAGRRRVRPGSTDGGYRTVTDPDGVEGGAADPVDQLTGGGGSPAPRPGPPQHRGRDRAAADPGGPGREGVVCSEAADAGRRDGERGGRGEEQPATRRGGAAAHTSGDGWGEGRPQPARIERGSDAALGGHADGLETAPNADGGRLGRGPELDGEPVGPGQRAPLGHDAERLGSGTWGDYWPAVDRWERVLGRRAPSPTVLGARGKRQLSPEFVEFMMGLQPGHVTAVPGLSRKAQLKILGNGVVPQQAAAAIRYLLPLLLDVPAPSAVGVWT